MAFTNSDFENELDRIFKEAQKIGGISSVSLNAGSIHKNMGNYPGANHRLPILCKVMQGKMKDDDSIQQTPASGQGASLTIIYKLPR